MTITDGLVTLEEYLNFTGQTAAATVARQTFFEDSITAASRWVESYTGRQFHKSDTTDTPVATARYFDSADAEYLSFPDAYSVTGIAVDAADDGSYSSTLLTTDFQLYPLGGYSPKLGTVPYTSARATSRGVFPNPYNYSREGLLRVTALWGWAAVPAPVKHATLLQTQDLVRDPEARPGGLVVVDVGVLGRSQNPRVLQLLEPYVLVSRKIGIA